MITVPKGKTVYIGSRRFCEGEVLPPHLRIWLKDEREEEKEVKPKRAHTRRAQ